ncbi:MAG: segregation/condensation protein A [Candidatus Melainabacteria bacterium]|nr:segregation/condensation protein A [Candidatus Melainabacteria bacterium]
MAQNGEIDPWDVDLEIVTEKYLSRIQSSITNNLKEAGKAIFFASTLLRMKSDILSMQAASALNIGREDDEDYLLEQELLDFNLQEIQLGVLDTAIVRKSINKKARYRPIKLEDLLLALRDAQEEDERRKRRSFDLSQFMDMDIFIEPEIESDDMLELTHAENIEEAINKSKVYLKEYLLNGNGIKFSRLCGFLQSWSNAFLVVLFLAHENNVKIIQQDFYGELWLYEPER